MPARAGTLGTGRRPTSCRGGSCPSPSPSSTCSTGIAGECGLVAAGWTGNMEASMGPCAAGHGQQTAGSKAVAIARQCIRSLGRGKPCVASKHWSATKVAPPRYCIKRAHLRQRLDVVEVRPAHTWLAIPVEAERQQACAGLRVSTQAGIRQRQESPGLPHVSHANNDAQPAQQAAAPCKHVARTVTPRGA